jgi:hypothetical protein
MATGKTVTVAVSRLPSLTALIVTDLPAARAVIFPVLLTLASDESLVVHVIARPVRELPRASLVVAVTIWEAPTGSRAVAGAIAMMATGPEGAFRHPSVRPMITVVAAARSATEQRTLWFPAERITT